jgi:hypothetical protein
MMYYSKNYRKFIENRQKKIDKFVVNCIGWQHVNRCIEVIDMALRDLVYKIVPTKVVIRELKTSSGKVLTADSEYVLVEKKRYVTVGKKTHVDYVFELDLKEDPAKLSAKQEQEKQEELKKKQNIFFLNFEDFSLMKLRATVFLLAFPVSLTLTMISVWLRAIPNTNFKTELTEHLTKDEIEAIAQAKHSIKDFTLSLLNHLRSLNDYLQQVVAEKHLENHFTMINESPEFKDFKDIFKNLKHTEFFNQKLLGGAVGGSVSSSEFFLQTFEKVQESYQKTLSQTTHAIDLKISQIQTELLKKV